MLLSVDMSSNFWVASAPVNVRSLGMLIPLMCNKKVKLVRGYLSFYNICGGQSHELRTANTENVQVIADTWWEVMKDSVGTIIRKTSGCDMFSNWFNCTINRICIWQPAKIRQCDQLIPRRLPWAVNIIGLCGTNMFCSFPKYLLNFRNTEKDNNFVRGLRCSWKRICVIIGVIQSVSPRNTWLLLLRKMPKMILNGITWCAHYLRTNYFNTK